MTNENYDNWATGIFLALLTVILVVLVTEVGHGLDLKYVYATSIFFGVGIFLTLILLLLAKVFETDEATYQPTIFHQTFFGEWSWLARGIAALVLIIGFTAGIVLTQHSIIPIVNPYDAGKLVQPSKDLFTTQGTTVSALRTGTYAGFGEDTLGYVFVAGLTFLQLLLWRRFDEESFDNILLIALSILIACGAWAFVFSSAHSAVYGLNDQAYWSAAIYGFTSQLVNQVVGAPVSILAHFTHNFVVVFGFSIALSITSTSFFIYRGKHMKHSKKGNIGLIIIGILVVLAIAAIAIVHYKPFGQSLSITSPSCGDYAPAPGSIACNTDQDCISKLVPSGSSLDSSIDLKCQANVCNIKLLSCGVQS